MSDALERVMDFDVAAEELWQAITEPAELASWLGDEVSIDVRPGGLGRVVDDGEERHLVVEEVEVGHRLSFTWWPVGPSGAAPATGTRHLSGKEDGTAPAPRQVQEQGSDQPSVVELVVVALPSGSRLTVRETLTAALPIASRSRWDLRLAVVGFHLSCRART